MSAARCRFLLESVADLQARLRARGSDLLIERGHPEDCIPALAARLLGSEATAVTLYAHTDVCSEEADVHNAVKSALPIASAGSGCGGTGAAVKEVWGNTLHHPSDLPYEFPNGLPEVFTPVSYWNRSWVIIKGSRVRVLTFSWLCGPLTRCEYSVFHLPK